MKYFRMNTYMIIDENLIDSVKSVETIINSRYSSIVIAQTYKK